MLKIIAWVLVLCGFLVTGAAVAFLPSEGSAQTNDGIHPHQGGTAGSIHPPR
jgi:hypothetical protein